MVSSWNYQELKQITNGSNSENIKNCKVTGFSIDSRSLKKGDIFCALKGKNHDGHKFIPEALKKGACLSLTNKQAKKLNLSLMSPINKSRNQTAFTVSIEAKKGVTTGISASDRAKTIMAAISKNADHKSIVRPGHIFPLIAHPGGVLYRAGHTEAGCDFAELANLEPASVICEILSEDGNMARLPELTKFAKEHQIKIGTIADLIEFRSRKEKLIKKISEQTISTNYGQMQLLLYSDLLSKNSHLALVKGKINAKDEVLVRVHEPLSILDFIDKKSQHSWPPLKALELINKAPNGVLIFLNYQESQNKISNILETINIPKDNSNDLRNYGIGSQILVDIGVKKMKLLASPRKMPSMIGYGLQVTEFIENNN